MVADRSGHLRFIARAHRRWVVWRVIECAGVCAAVGAGVALLVVLVLLWRAEPGVLPALLLMGVGAVAGGIWGWSHRPTLLKTAILIDRQLGLHDLISTAMSEQKWGDEGFREIILEQARVRCESISPNELVLRRLGSRQWGGIGIAAALVLTVGLMSGQATQTQARIEPYGSERLEASLAENAKRTQPGDSRAQDKSQVAAAKRVTSYEPGDDRGDFRGREATGSGSRSTPTADGSGAEAVRTLNTRVAPLRQPDGSADPNEPAGTLPSGGGQRTGPGSAVDPSGYSQNTTTGSIVTPWQSNTWSEDAARGTQRLDGGQVPDAYRELVREYFLQPMNK